MRAIFAALVLLAVVALGAAAQPATHDYAVGQVWKYHTQPGDADSLIRIGAIEESPVVGTIYHIGVIGVHVPGMNVPTTIGHLPVSRHTLDMSVTELTKSEAAFPDMASGIEQWRQAHGGVFTISIAEIAGMIAKNLGNNAEH
jgi:hypothetical protein